MKKILINDNPWQNRVAIIRDDDLENIYFQTPSTQNLERCYFKGVVSKILPGIQTAFVNFGQERAGFLHISEIDRELAIKRMTDQIEDLEETEHVGRSETITRRNLDIRKILREGEKILVQVSKEPMYEKGAKLTTCFTLPGRFLVLMPNIPRIGISKKIEDREERQRLKELILKNLPEGMGAIIRTSSAFKDERELLQDLTYLLETWQGIQDAYENAQAEQKLYEDLDIVLQVIRDNLDHDVDVVICDTVEMQNKVFKFIKQIAPEYGHKVQLYQESRGLFEKYQIDKQIEQALHQKVYLKSGGSLIIETTEAMTVIDVNTGRFTGHGNLEDTILKTNLEAAEEIVRQLRLRNIGGLIVIDFIDMSSGTNRQKLFRFLDKTLKDYDKFQSVVLKVSEFGLVQMTRKRSGKTLMQQMMENCNLCHGLGATKTIQTESFAILCKLKNDLGTKKLGNRVSLSVHPSILNYITTTEYNTILFLEKTFKCKIVLTTHTTEQLNVFSISSLKN